MIGIARWLTGTACVLATGSMLLAGLSGVARAQAGARLGAQSWTLSFTITRFEDAELMNLPQHHTTVHQSSASGAFTLTLVGRGPGGTTWEGEGMVHLGVEEQRTNLFQDQEGQWHLLEHAHTRGGESVLGTALMSIDASESTFGLTLSAGTIDVVVHITDFLGTRSETRANAFSLGAAVRDQPIPPSGPLAGSDVQRQDTGFGQRVTTVTWRLVPAPSEAGGFTFDPCPCGDPMPPDLDVASAAAGPYPEPDLTPGRVGIPRARQVAEELAGDPVFCSVAVLPEAIRVGDEITELLTEEARAHPLPWDRLHQREVADRLAPRVERLIEDLEARDPSLPQVRSLLYAEGILQLLDPEETDQAGLGMEAGQRAFERYARETAGSADLPGLLEMAAQSQLLGLDDLGDELLEFAEHVAFMELEAATRGFDVCRATAEDLAQLMDVWVRWALVYLGGDEGPQLHLSHEYVQRVLDRLNGIPDPACPEDEEEGEAGTV